MKPPSLLFLASFGVFGYAAISNQAPSPREINFDRDVMPIISQHCFKCHGPDATKAAAGLRLDSFAGATKSGAIVAGAPEKSLLIERVSAQDPANRMPPQDSGVKPLTKDQIDIVREWIKQGAHYEKHWSYVPPTMPTLPAVSDPKWCKNPIDEFVLAKLDQAHLKPEPEADKNTLALRAAQTLTGLPPYPADLDRFLKDTQPGAYERFVDHLLAQPTYGEHEARYWLDAVRYGDTHGLQLDNERGVYPYRDWVVRAYSQDLPFTDFVKWQLAGDLLPHPTNEQRVATGYIRMNLTSNEGGAIEEEFLARNTFDRVDTTSTVFLGLTVGCARCHDHKYDPIKQKDYYGLYAFFDSTTDAPLDNNIALPPPVVRAPSPEQSTELAVMDRSLSHLRSNVDSANALVYFEQNHAPLPVTRNWEISPVYSATSFDKAFDKVEFAEPGQASAVEWKPFNFEVGTPAANIIGKDNSSVYVRGIVNLRSPRTMTFGVSSDDAIKVWLNGKLIHSNKASRGVDTAVDSVRADFKAGDNILVAKVVNGAGPDGLNIILSKPAEKQIDDAITGFRKAPTNEASSERLRTAFMEYGPASPEALEFRRISNERAELEASRPQTLVAEEMPTPRPTFILKRGLYDQKGDPVTRHIPAALGDLLPGSPTNRLGFAQWLTSPANPLLARVYVNRIWQQHFGLGIVKTTDDFGSQGEWPLNQPLLDYLAVSFERNGWSVKKLNREIVTSAAFRQRSRITEAKLTRDPENRLISRGPRFRLDAEVIRDKALLSGGLLVRQGGGKGFRPYQPDGLWEGASDPVSNTHIYVREKGASTYRRSLYMFWKRTSPPPAMVTFDAPLRDTCIVRRSTTNTPLQALALENEPAFLEASRTMAERLLVRKGDDESKLITAFWITMARPPKLSEIELLKNALGQYRHRYSADASAATKLVTVGDAPHNKSIAPSEEAPWMLICSTLMNTDEFMTLH